MAEILSAASLVVVAVLLFLLLFEPAVAYRVRPSSAAPDSAEFLNYLSAIVSARPFTLQSAEVLNSGEATFSAELAAIRGARHSVHLEAYLFLRGRVADQFLAALEERARAGVKVRVIADRYGSLLTPSSYFAGLRRAGGEVHWYQPIAWYTLKRLNNRTHRDLVIVDGEIGFVGGIGVADYWVGPAGRSRPWRDTMLRVTGDLVRGLQTSFAENWLEASGEILPAEDFAPSPEVMPAGRGFALVVASSPSEGRATRARMLFQILMASARREILICNPYFIPDRSLCRELVDAVKRGVRVTLLMPGPWNNHPMVRLASRRRYGLLLEAGVAIHEYQPTMMHAKVMVIDGVWSVLGSTNMDNRSFGLNDEVNVAIQQPELAARLQADFAADLARCLPVRLEDWRRRALTERAFAALARVLERQA